MAGRQSSKAPSVWQTFAVPIACACIVIISILVGGLSHPSDSPKTYFQVTARNLVDVVTRRPVSETARNSAKP
jgi:hypothetical protein